MRLSIITPTADPARPLTATLQSAIAAGFGPLDEYLIIGDEVGGQQPAIRAKVAEFDSRFKYVPGPGATHSWGHDQCNTGMRYASGDYIAFIDDDDVWADGALSTIHRVIEKSTIRQPRMFRFITPWREVFWREKRVIEGQVSGQCLVVPNDQSRLGVWTKRYNGDYDFISETILRWGGDAAVDWREEIIAITRPGESQ